MAKTESQVVVCDAGPLIHLDELGCLDLLQNIGNILLPHEVWLEVVGHRPRLSIHDLPNSKIIKIGHDRSARLMSLADSLDLDKGELAAIALMESISAQRFLCDDAAARLAAESLDFTVHGSIGILIRSVRTAQRTRQQILNLLRELPDQSTLHISRQLLRKVVAEIERATE